MAIKEQKPHTSTKAIGKRLLENWLILCMAFFSVLLLIAFTIGIFVPAYQYRTAEALILDGRDDEARSYLEEADTMEDYWTSEWHAMVSGIDARFDQRIRTLLRAGKLSEARAIFTGAKRTPPACLESALAGHYCDLINLYQLSAFTVPSNVTTLTIDAFGKCPTLTSLTIPNSVTAIERGTLAECEALTTLSLPFTGGTATEHTHLGYIFGADTPEDNADHLPEALSAVTVTDGPAIDDRAFYGCNTLRSVTLPAQTVSIGKQAFYDCEALEAAVLPTSITEIGFEAFYGCDSLQYLTVPFVGHTATDGENGYFGYIFGAPTYEHNHQYVPRSLKNVVITGGTAIADHAFDSCSFLSSVILPTTVSHIGDYAFYGCPDLLRLHIPEGVRQIGSHAFYGCHALRSLQLPDGVTSIGPYAFYGCENLSELTVPSSLKVIDYAMFSGCTGLISITLHENITAIGVEAFYGCNRLESITLPNGVTEIGGRAFFDCKALNRITFSQGLESIGGQAFEGCVALKSVTLPTSLLEIGFEAFAGCDSLSQISLPFTGRSADDTAYTHFGYIFGATSYAENSTLVPASVQAVTVSNGTRIADYAFEGCASLTAVTLPAGIVHIGGRAFFGCRHLTAITLPVGLKTIGGQAFADCVALTSVTLPESLEEIGFEAFADCNSLNHISLPFTGRSANDTEYTNFGYIFGASSYVENAVRVPASLRTVAVTAGNWIADYAFEGCASLTAITVPANATKIGGRAFFGCENLCSVSLPVGLQSIGGQSFEGCGALTAITVPDHVREIGYGAFADCSALMTITLPFVGNTANSADASHFGYIFGAALPEENSTCVPASLSTVIIKGGTAVAGRAFYGCSNVTELVLPQSLLTVGNSAFEGCTSLDTLYYSDSATAFAALTIGEGNTALTAADRYFYTAEAPAAGENGWHYVDGKPPLGLPQKIKNANKIPGLQEHSCSPGIFLKNSVFSPRFGGYDLLKYSFAP
ncbi:MAG: leucine-rich repeat domain-containing protein [Clostridia bacterium]|nr:leucine-rich repeat domain-containing protein [Clostridia bacterium]